MACRHPLALLVWVLWAASATGQESGAALQFNFSNPGARSLGLGGAFAGLADDATAAFANPAGLVQLIRPEVSLEGRLWRFSTPFTAGGRLSGQATGIGLDDTNGLRFGESSTDASSVSFVSYVYPKGRGSVAFFRYQLAKFEVESQTDGLFRFNPAGILETTRFDARLQTTDIDVASWGVAGAFRVAEKVSLGLAIVYSQLDMAFFDAEFDVTNETFEGVFIDPIPLTADNLEVSLDTLADNTDWTLNAGLLWQPDERWGVALRRRAGLGPEDALGDESKQKNSGEVVY